MKAIRNLATLAAVAMMFATVGANRAHAQAFVQGSFRLPFHARWGSVNLAPNRYTFKIVGSGMSRVVVLSSRNNNGDDPIYHILGVLGDPPASAGKNELQCQSRGAVCVVRTLRLGFADETIYFTASKSLEREVRGRKNHTQRRRSAAAIETVPIVISGK